MPTSEKPVTLTLTQEELDGLLACAWDDGYGCGFDDCDDNPLVSDCRQNPYR